MTNTARPEETSPWRMVATRLFGSFASVDFRWLWANNFATGLGFTMEFLAQGWLVLEMTDSPLWVGIVSGVRGAGVVAFGALGGLLADRVNRRNVVAATQVLRALILLALAFLILSERVAIWHLVGASLLSGVLMAMSMPAGNALVYDTAGRQRLLNAMAARLFSFNLSRIGGSIVAGVLISIGGVGACYLATALVFLASPIALIPLKAGKPAARTPESLWRNLVEGLHYARKSRPLRALLLLSLLAEMFGFSHQVMLPVIARDVLHVGAPGLSFLSAAGGVGAMAGTLTIAFLGEARGKGRFLAVASALAGVSLVLFALSPWLLLSAALEALVSGGLMAYDATMSTLLQLISTDEMRGRVMGLYGLTYGFTPVGGFTAGALATAVSAPFALAVGGLVIAAYAGGISRLLWRLREG